MTILSSFSFLYPSFSADFPVSTYVKKRADYPNGDYVIAMVDACSGRCFGVISLASQGVLLLGSWKLKKGASGDGKQGQSIAHLATAALQLSSTSCAMNRPLLKFHDADGQPFNGQVETGQQKFFYAGTIRQGFFHEFGICVCRDAYKTTYKGSWNYGQEHGFGRLIIQYKGHEIHAFGVWDMGVKTGVLKLAYGDRVIGYFDSQSKAVVMFPTSFSTFFSNKEKDLNNVLLDCLTKPLPI